MPNRNTQNPACVWLASIPFTIAISFLSVVLYLSPLRGACLVLRDLLLNVLCPIRSLLWLCEGVHGFVYFGSGSIVDNIFYSNTCISVMSHSHYFILCLLYISSCSCKSIFMKSPFMVTFFNINQVLLSLCYKWVTVNWS